MKKIIFLSFSLFCSVVLFGYKKTGIDLSIKGGYREDSIEIKSRFDMPNVSLISFYDMKFIKLKSIQAMGYGNIRLFGLTVNAAASYASLISGDGVLTWPIMTGIDNYFIPSDLMDLKGDFWDYYATLGYGIELYNSKFILVPQVGYGEFNQKIKKTKVSKEISIPTDFGMFPAILYYLSDATKQDFQIKWWGPNFGGDIIFDFKNFFQFELGYFFHILSYELKDAFSYSLIVDFTSFEGVVDEEMVDEKILQKQNALGHQLRGKLSYKLFDHWKIAGYGDFFYFKASDAPISSDEKKVRLIGNPPLEINNLKGRSDTKKKSYSVSFELSYVF